VGSLRKRLFLPTSPELHLKQMLANGLTDIFEIKTVFRNGEITERHEPEFQMLEWYRAYNNLDLIRDDLVGLVRAVNGEDTDVLASSMRELFARHLQFSLTPQTSREELRELCKRSAVDHLPSDDWNELFHRVFVEKIEPFVGVDAPEIVYDFPPSMAALARLTPEGFADRFELFWRGSEIANAFHELNDPVEQRARFEREIAERRAKGRTELQIDENFMRALEAGLPPSGGIALGLDRLFMAVHGLAPIAKARAFGVKHQL
jgi:lysyl-tRNA synthetase class 2